MKGPLELSALAIHDVLNTTSRRRAGELHSCFQITSLVWLDSVPACFAVCIHERTHFAVYMVVPGQEDRTLDQRDKTNGFGRGQPLFGGRGADGALRLEPRNKSRCLRWWFGLVSRFPSTRTKTPSKSVCYQYRPRGSSEGSHGAYQRCSFSLQ